jgi:hypothetical protein
MYSVYEDYILAHNMFDTLMFMAKTVEIERFIMHENMLQSLLKSFIIKNNNACSIGEGTIFGIKVKINNDLFDNIVLVRRKEGRIDIIRSENI